MDGMGEGGKQVRLIRCCIRSLALILYSIHDIHLIKGRGKKTE